MTFQNVSIFFFFLFFVGATLNKFLSSSYLFVQIFNVRIFKNFRIFLFSLLYPVF